MSVAVVDTNVIAVADDRHEDVSAECRLACISCLEKIKKSGKLALDDRRRIIKEYLRLYSPGRQKGPGSVFLEWVLQNQSSSKVARVVITEIEEDVFAEIKNDGFQSEIDPPDRKFIAVALGAQRLNPQIFQAVDSEWLLWLDPLHAAGVRVSFLCSSEIVRFFQRKFPDMSVPELSVAD